MNMIINVYSLAGHLGFNNTYYSFGDKENGQHINSQLYPNKAASLQSIQQTILWLRTLGEQQQNNFIRKAEDGFSIHLFEENTVPFVKTPLIDKKKKAIDLLTSLRKDSHLDVFTINHFELFVAREADYLSADSTLEAIAESIMHLPAYQWKAAESSILNLSKQKTSSSLIAAAKAIPTAGLLLNQPCAPLFNLLQPYGKSDAHRFFGRDAEVEALYEQTFDARLLTVYGDRAVGKSSLVKCGLANRLKANKWQEIYMRRWLDVNDSLRRNLQEAAEEIGCENITKDTKPLDTLRSIYQLSFQPILLIFDQFEQLFTLPYNVAEQQQFFTFLQELIQDTSFPAKVILIIRDEYLAKLADYETIVPTILEHRFHLKHLSKTALKVVVNGLLGQLVTSGQISIENPELVTQKITDNLAGQKSNVGLACTQVYLHQTHQLNCRNAIDGLSVFSPDLIDKAGAPEPLINQYVNDRIASLEQQLPDDQGAVLSGEQAREIEELVEMQNFCGCSESELRSMWLDKWHERGQRNRQLVWFLRLCLLALILGVLALGFTYCSLVKQAPCLLAEQSENCEDRINYLCHSDVNNECANNLTKILNQEDCPIWLDYQNALSENNCFAYQNYLKKYQNSGVCLDKFYQILTERGCPTSTDTLTMVVFDTIYQEITINGGPSSFENRDPIKNNNKCQLKFGKPTVKLGPLFMMTSNLNNGTRYDWIGALAACKSLGPNWRLPCAGEIDFILDRHYRDAASAYENLTQGECPIIETEDTSVSGSFWTATEANDVNAWSIVFDTKNENVRLITDTKKSTAMPCRCVYRDPTITSGIPDCFEKQVYRPGG